jgi:hypothetical protein
MKQFIPWRALVLGVVVVAGLAPARVLAQGESAVPFLLISPTSRYAGMGEAGTGWVDDASAVFWNPGALAFQDGIEISLTHANWLPKFNLPDLFYDYLNYRQRIDDIGGTVSASFTYLNLGEFSVTSSSGPEVIGKFKSYEYAITAGYSTAVWESFGLGINLRYIHSALSPIGTEQEQGNGIASTVSFDIGGMFRPDSTWGGFWEDFSAGFNLSNIGPKVTYVDADQADPLPTNLRIGLGYRLLNDEYNQLQLALDFGRLLVNRNEDGTSDDVWEGIFTTWGDGSGLRKVITNIGAEYWYGAPKLIALRIGYFYEDPNFGNRKFLTLGAGIRYDIYGFDFSYISPVGNDSENSPLGDTIRFSLLISWGS